MIGNAHELVSTPTSAINRQSSIIVVKDDAENVLLFQIDVLVESR